MSQAVSPDLLGEVWEYPLFDALNGRRSRRFGLGFETTQGPYPYKSPHLPLSLTEAEEALLVAAGIGLSGMALWDQSRPLPARSADGRTFPSTCGGHRTALFFTNDQGVHVINPAAGRTAAMRAAKKPPERSDVLELYRRHRKTLRRGRLAIPRRTPALCAHNLWNSNMPGSTLFMPVTDVSFSLIALIAQFVDPCLERFAGPPPRRGMHIVDDRFGFRPAGTAHWLKTGFVDPDNVIALSHLERQACYFMFSEPAAICQNIFLATEAIGLGGWMHCGFLSRDVFAELGFRMHKHEPATLANPVGLDGVFEAFCPPYCPTMDAAVDAVLAPLRHMTAGAEATLSPGRPIGQAASGTALGANAVAVSEEGVACTKAVCNYIYQTYGRFPGGVDAMHLMWFMQAHHLDVGYYRRFFPPEACTPRHAKHLDTWHGSP